MVPVAFSYASDYEFKIVETCVHGNMKESINLYSAT
jgi:hypothetical protein